MNSLCLSEDHFYHFFSSKIRRSGPFLVEVVPFFEKWSSPVNPETPMVRPFFLLRTTSRTTSMEKEKKYI